MGMGPRRRPAYGIQPGWEDHGSFSEQQEGRTGGMELRICREGVMGVLALSRARSSGGRPLGRDPTLSGPMKLEAMAGDPSLAHLIACEPPSCAATGNIRPP